MYPERCIHWCKHICSEITVGVCDDEETTHEERHKEEKR
jgi:hypothetical protein